MRVPIISGLYKLIAHKRQDAAWKRAKAAKPSTDPRIAHDAELDAKRLEEEVAKLEGQVKSDESVIENIEMLIKYLVGSPHQSAQRTLAQRALEEASMRLRRELGDKPEPSE